MNDWNEWLEEYGKCTEKMYADLDKALYGFAMGYFDQYNYYLERRYRARGLPALEKLLAMTFRLHEREIFPYDPMIVQIALSVFNCEKTVQGLNMESWLEASRDAKLNRNEPSVEIMRLYKIARRNLADLIGLLADYRK